MYEFWKVSHQNGGQANQNDNFEDNSLNYMEGKINSQIDNQNDFPQDFFNIYQDEEDKFADDQSSLYLNLPPKNSEEIANRGKNSLVSFGVSEPNSLKFDNLQNDIKPIARGFRQESMINFGKKSVSLYPKPKTKLKERVRTYLLDILQQQKPLLVQQIADLVRKKLHITWQKQQVNYFTIDKMINQTEELKKLYQKMKANIKQLPQNKKLQYSSLNHDYCKKILRLLQNKQQHRIYFAFQCDFPIIYSSEKKSKSQGQPQMQPLQNDHKIIFRGILGSNYHAYWDFINEDQSRESMNLTFRYIIDLIDKRHLTSKKYLILSKEFVALYRQTIEYAFKKGINLIQFPSNAHSINPLWYWLRDMKYQAIKNEIKSIAELKQFFHYQTSRIFEKCTYSSYFCLIKRLMLSQLKKGIQIGFVQSAR